MRCSKLICFFITFCCSSSIIFCSNSKISYVTTKIQNAWHIFDNSLLGISYASHYLKFGDSQGATSDPFNIIKLFQSQKIMFKFCRTQKVKALQNDRNNCTIIYYDNILVDLGLSRRDHVANVHSIIIAFYLDIEYLEPTMGTICEKFQQQPEIYSRKSSIELQYRQGSLGCCDFQFTTRTVNHTNSDCLLVFIDPYYQVKYNSFLNKINEHVAYKVQQYLDAYLEAHSLGVGEFAILDVEIEKLRVNKIALLCVNVWEAEATQENERDLLKDKYQSHLQELFFQLLQTGIKRPAITQFNDEFGIPLQYAYKMIAKTVVFHGSGFRKVTMLCHNVQSRVQEEDMIVYYHREYERLIEEGFHFENSKGSIINLQSPFKESLSSNYL